RGSHSPAIIVCTAYVSDSRDHRLQLACYAIALKTCDPHRDFPASLKAVNITDIDLIEIQLLTKKQRHYKLSNDDCTEVEVFILESAREMEMAKAGLLRKGVEANMFPVAHSPTTCRFCQFRSLCWEE
ncbi:PD-(D/E)XK nuclease family protein, partial [Nitrosomonas nitrosa]|uniref:PD-(D/E)XK nuclease family protein n=1 Tax=Nitrosomonas nitrosa TaxID=52442 RepID=UPI0023FA1EC1